MNKKPERRDEFEWLRYAYQGIEAPPYLVTRIVAGIEKPPEARRYLWPALAGVFVAVGVAALLSVVSQQAGEPSGKPQMPSLTSLARAVPDRPAMSMPSLGNLRTVQTPAVPSRPVLRAPNEPSPDSGQSMYYLPEETHYEHG